ncbi:MAG: TRAP transporter small permease [Betaproteobacteria bacterium]|nr:TRAP transporter small permease [Betaproteobacteria bacterium]
MSALKGSIHALSRVLEALELVGIWVSGVALAVVTLVITYQVFARYVLRSPISWFYDISEWTMAGIVFLGAAYTLRMRRHVRVEFLEEHLPRKLAAGLRIVTSLLALVYFLVMIWFGWQTTSQAYQRNFTSSNPPFLPSFPALLVLPLGGLLVCLRLIVNILNDLEVLVEHESPGTVHLSALGGSQASRANEGEPVEAGSGAAETPPLPLGTSCCPADADSASKHTGRP